MRPSPFLLTITLPFLAAALPAPLPAPGLFSSLSNTIDKVRNAIGSPNGGGPGDVDKLSGYLAQLHEQLEAFVPGGGGVGGIGGSWEDQGQGRGQGGEEDGEEDADDGEVRNCDKNECDENDAEEEENCDEYECDEDEDEDQEQNCDENECDDDDDEEEDCDEEGEDDEGGLSGGDGHGPLAGLFDGLLGGGGDGEDDGGLLEGLRKVLGELGLGGDEEEESELLGCVDSLQELAERVGVSVDELVERLREAGVSEDALEEARGGEEEEDGK